MFRKIMLATGMLAGVLAGLNSAQAQFRPPVIVLPPVPPVDDWKRRICPPLVLPKPILLPVLPKLPETPRVQPQPKAEPVRPIRAR